MITDNLSFTLVPKAIALSANYCQVISDRSLIGESSNTLTSTGAHWGNNNYYGDPVNLPYFGDPFTPVDNWQKRFPDLNKSFEVVATSQPNVAAMLKGKSLWAWDETDQVYKYESVLARFRKENIDVSAELGSLHVRAEQDGLNFYTSLELPRDADVDSVVAKLDHGVLYITVKKDPALQPKKITVQD